MKNECRKLIFLLFSSSRVDLFVKKQNCRSLSLIRNVPSGEERGETDGFRRLSIKWSLIEVRSLQHVRESPTCFYYDLFALDQYNLNDVILRTVTRFWYFAIFGKDAFLLVSIFLARLRRKSEGKTTWRQLLFVVVIIIIKKKEYSKWNNLKYIWFTLRCVDLD